MTPWQRLQFWTLDNPLDEIAGVGGASDPEGGLRYLRAHGVTAIHVKLHDGQDEVNVGVPGEIRAAARRAGLSPFVVGGWGQNREEAVPDAEKANGLVARDALGYWIAAVEFEYKGEPGSARWRRMGEYLARVSEVQPLGPMLRSGQLAVCVMPNETRGDEYDWAAIRQTPARIVTECYPNEFPTAPGQWPDEAQAGVNEQGFARSYHHPAIGLYQSDGGRLVSAHEYVASLWRARALGMGWGFSVYGHGETLDDWATLAALTKPATPKAPSTALALR